VLDLFSLITNALYGQFLYHAGKVEESIDQFHETLNMESRFSVAHIPDGRTLQQPAIIGVPQGTIVRAFDQEVLPSNHALYFFCHFGTSTLHLGCAPY
jgi:hypothetical protein